ncbi:MAG: purine-nucleoside phosphorylase [bacterium]
MQIPNELQHCGAQTAIVLGSGLGCLAESLPQEYAVDYSKLRGLQASGAPGHAGRFLVARLQDRPLLLAHGRLHLYEGWSAREVVRIIDVMHAIGIQTLLLTNAAGTLKTAYEPGTWMMLSDHINLLGASPLRGGPNFIDMSEVYSVRLRGLFRNAAIEAGFTLHEGVYAAVQGPQFETPAEIRMLRVLGADAVGMSTVPEVIQAHALGMEVAGFSCLTNWAAGLAPTKLCHEDVSAVGQAAAGRMLELLQAVFPKI